MEPLNREVLDFETTRDEGGHRLKAYKDTAPVPCWTIAVGRNLDATRGGPHGPLGISAQETAELFITRASCLQKGITLEQSKVLFRNDMDLTLAELDRVFPWWRTLDPVRQRVLANMGFNMGIPRLSGFRKFLQYARAGDYANAAVEMLDSRWANQVHERATRLAELMKLGPRKL